MSGWRKRARLHVLRRERARACLPDLLDASCGRFYSPLHEKKSSSVFTLSFNIYFEDFLFSLSLTLTYMCFLKSRLKVPPEGLVCNREISQIVTKHLARVKVSIC